MDNIRFNLAAFILLVLLNCVAMIRKAPKVTRKRLFSVCCYCNLIFLILDTVASVLLSKNAHPRIFLILYSATIMFIFLSAAFSASYFYTVLRGRLSLPRQQFLIFAPTVILFFMLTANIFHPLMFYLTSEGKIDYLPFFFLICITSLYYIGYIATLTAKSWDSMKQKDRLVVILLLVLCFSAVMVQAFFPDIQPINLVLPLVALLTYLSIESTSSYIDIKTDLQNGSAFYAASATLIRAKANWECLLVILDSIPSMDNEFDSELTDKFLYLAAKFLTRISKKVTVMHVKRNMFALCYKGTDGLEEDRILSLIEKRFSSPFTIGSINIVHSFCCCRISYPEHYKTYEDFCSFVELAADPYNRPAKKMLSASDLDLNSLNRKKFILSLMQTALADGTIKITYQPIFNCNTQKAEGVETDFYIKDRSIGFAYSKEIMEAAEELGIAKHIFLYIYHSVCGTIQKAHLIDHKVSFVELPIPMNALLKNGAEKIISEIADIYFVPRSKIRFVLPEKAIANYSPFVLRNINRIQEQGFSFTFADLGNSQSNIQMLLKASIAETTISIPALEKATQQNRVTQAMNNLIETFKKFGVKIKAKEIVSNSQNIAAQLYAVDSLQGDFYSPPLTQEDLVKFFSLEALHA